MIISIRCNSYNLIWCRAFIVYFCLNMNKIFIVFLYTIFVKIFRFFFKIYSFWSTYVCTCFFALIINCNFFLFIFLIPKYDFMIFVVFRYIYICFIWIFWYRNWLNFFYTFILIIWNIFLFITSYNTWLWWKNVFISILIFIINCSWRSFFIP